MSDTSSIEWTDATWNPVRGCTKISAGCKNCYAETFSERWRGVKGHPFEQGFDLRLVYEKLTAPLKWRKSKRVFVNSMSDLFHEDVPDDYIDRVFGVMAACRYIGPHAMPGHTFQVLTKRAERMEHYLSTDRRKEWASAAVTYGGGHDPDGLHDQTTFGPRALPNVWLGVSVENQEAADERIPHLARTSAAVKFLSCEPLLGPLDLKFWLRGRALEPRHGGAWLTNMHPDAASTPGTWWPTVGWVIVGGESGPGAREFDLDWARSIVTQCQGAGVPAFVKQMGSNAMAGVGSSPCRPRLGERGDVTESGTEERTKTGRLRITR